MTRSIEQRSVLRVDAVTLWAAVTTEQGINHELGPWLRMRMPRSVKGLSLETVPVGEPLGGAVLFALGFLPCEVDWLTWAERVPGQSFDEQSSMIAMRQWRHQRSLVALSETETEVIDTVTFTARRTLAWSEPLMRVIVGALFAHRHRRLRSI